VNASVFIQFCMDKGPADGNVHNGALVVLMDQLHMNDSGKMMAPANSNAVKRHFWETVGESNCKTTEIKGPGRTDPLLQMSADDDAKCSCCQWASKWIMGSSRPSQCQKRRGALCNEAC